MDNKDYNLLLNFWFGEERKREIRSCLWFNGISPENKKLRTLEDTDLYIKEQWEDILNTYPTDKYIDLFSDEHILKSWLDTCDGKVALMILFDQFPSHIYRGCAKSYAFEHYALSLSNDLIKNYFHTLDVPYKICIFLTQIHSEIESFVTEATLNMLIMADNETNEHLKVQLIKLSKTCQEHLDVLRKFGRYPHRNIVLNRKDTTDEIDFLDKKNMPMWMKPVTKKVVKKSRLISNEINKKKNDLPDAQKLEILVLHGNRQSAKIFKNKTEKDFEKKLKKIANLTYCDSPRLYQQSVNSGESTSETKDHYSSTKDEPIREWWNAIEKDGSIIYEGLEDSLEYINRLFKYNRYDGIIGFSQGSTLVGIISAFVNDFRNGKNVPVHINNITDQLKFVVMISGFYCRDSRPEFKNCILEEMPIEHIPEQIKIRKDLIKIPSFHIWGTDDKMVLPWRSAKLSDAFENKKICIHTSGHFSKAIKHWDVNELFQWLNELGIKDTEYFKHISDCNKIFLDNKIDTIALKEFTTKYVNMDTFLINHVITSNMYSCNLLYKLLKELFVEDVVIYSKTLEILNDNPSAWKELIDMDTAGDNDKFRPLLVKLISNKLVEEYNKYYITKYEGVPNELVNYAPKYNVTYRTSKLYCEVSLYIASHINIFDDTANFIKRKDDDDKISAYIQYNKILSRLAKIYNSMKDKPQIKKHVLRISLEDSLKKPLSDHIINPKAEPVDISARELLEPLHTFLRNEDDENIKEELVFTRGTICIDGRLDLCKQVIGPSGIKDLLKSLEIDSCKSKPKVKHLLLGNNLCGNELGNAVGKFIASGKSSLTSWYIAGNNLDDNGIKPVCEALCKDTTVKQLWLKRNPIRFEGIKHIINMFKYNSYLQVLDLTNTGIMDEGAILLLNNLSKSLKYLYLSSNGLTDKTCKFIAENIQNIKLSELSLGCNRLTDLGAKYLGQALAHPECNIAYLEIASCAIGTDGVKYISDALKINKSLLKLNLGFLKSTNDIDEIPNIIGSHGAIHIANMLSVNTTIRSMDLSHTGILKAGLIAISDVIANKNNTIISLNIIQHSVPQKSLSMEIIKKSLEKNIGLITEEKMTIINNIIEPQHLQEIKSVYRIK